MIGGNGGSLDDMSMMDLFRMEAENQCNQLSEDLLALEQDPTASGLLESLMRASHSVKGAARIVGLHPAVQVAHAMEDVFVAAQGSRIILDREGINLLLKGVDMLNSISQVPDGETGNFFAGKTAEISSLVNSFTALAEGKRTSAQGPVKTLVENSGETLALRPIPAKINGIESGQLPVDLSSMSMLDLFRLEMENLCSQLSEARNGMLTVSPRSSMRRPMLRRLLLRFKV